MEITAFGAIIAAIFGFVSTTILIIKNALDLRDRASKPEQKQDERLTNLESDVTTLKTEVNQLKEDMTSSRKSLETVKSTMLESTAILMKAIQQIITHELDQNNTKGLEKARDELSKFVWQRLGYPEDNEE